MDKVSNDMKRHHSFDAISFDKKFSVTKKDSTKLDFEIVQNVQRELQTTNQLSVSLKQFP